MPRRKLNSFIDRENEKFGEKDEEDDDEHVSLYTPVVEGKSDKSEFLSKNFYF